MRSCRASLRRAKPWLGTLVEISASADLPPDALLRATDEAFIAVREIHALMSFHEPDSDVSRLNRQAYVAPVAVDPRTWAVLAYADRVSRASSGAFDVTVAPLLVEWGFLPTPSAAPLPDPAARFEAIELLDGHRVRFRLPAWIDLGGIAKGYAVDAAAQALRRRGVTDYVVNAGGDLAIGAYPRPVHVRDPSNPQALHYLGTFSDIAVATSGAYFAAGPSRPPGTHPLVDPTRGASASDLGSVSVLAARAITADALTKVVAVSPSASVEVLRSFGATPLCWHPATSPNPSARLAPTGAARHDPRPGPCGS